MEYPIGFKARMVQRLTGPDAIAATTLSEEVGVAQSTLSRWKARASTILAMSKSNDSHKQPPDKRPAEEKLRLVLEASRLSDEELGAFLRKEGLHESHLETWKQSILAALGSSTKSPRRARKGSGDAKKVKALEKELRRKEKALVEAAALLMLKKKADAIWGDGDDGTGGRNDG